LVATRPTKPKSRISAIPVTTVGKITVAMIILTSLMKVSPIGFIASPVCGLKCLSSTPSTCS
jgi:hypothetical protein